MRPKKSRVPVWAIVLACVAVVAPCMLLVGYAFTQKVKKAAARLAITPEVWKTVELKQVVGDLVREYRSNEIAGETKYKDKTVVVMGTVGSVERFRDVATVKFSTGILGSDNMYCRFDYAHESEIAALHSDMRVVIIGHCDGLEFGYVVLSSCRVVKWTDNPNEKKEWDEGRWVLEK